MQNNNKYGLHENILIMLEMKAKQTGKSLDDMVSEYRNNLEERKKETGRINDFINTARKVIENTGKSFDEVLNECFINAGLERPTYIKYTANTSLRDIAEGQTVVFNAKRKTLEDKEIYLLKVDEKEVVGIYDKQRYSFIIDNQDNVLKNSRQIEVIGQLAVKNPLFLEDFIK